MTATRYMCSCGTAVPSPGRTGGRPALHCSLACRNATRRAEAAIERSTRPARPPRPARLCTITDCAKPHYAHDWCQMHYRRWVNNGGPHALLPVVPFPDRFWDKVYPCPITGCWFWAGALDPAGYGRSADDLGAIRLAHRLSYQLSVGDIPDDRPHLDHVCRVKCCVRPEHLEPVTQQENNRRQHLAWLRSRELEVSA